MNPLKQSQIQTLDSINCMDLRKKIQELVGFCNKQTETNQDVANDIHAIVTDYELERSEQTNPQEHEAPMGISQWLAHGRKYGYDKYHDKCEHEGEKYNELIMAVENKYWGETRHQTALRLIKEAQSSSFTAKSDKLQTK